MDMEKIDRNTFLFPHPWNMIIAGPSGAGKTQYTKKLIKNISEMTTHPPQQIFWSYGEWQSSYDEMHEWPNMTFVSGLVKLDELKTNPDIPKLYVIDDLMSEATDKSQYLMHLFTKISHHYNISVCMLVQSAFYPGMRTARLNAHLICLFKNPADNLQTSILARQIFPGRQKYMMQAFSDATSTPYSYLLLDLTQGTPEQYRLRTNIFPGEHMVIYMPK